MPKPKYTTEEQADNRRIARHILWNLPLPAEVLEDARTYDIAAALESQGLISISLRSGLHTTVKSMMMRARYV